MRGFLLPALVSAVVSGTVSALVVAGIAFAVIPDGNNVIHACYDTTKGDLRVIDSPDETCRKTETALKWARSGLTDHEVATAQRTVSRFRVRRPTRSARAARACSAAGF